MVQKRRALKRRTTLTLPSDSLLQAKRIAHSRRVNLSTVISEAMSAGLRLEAAKQRRTEFLGNYRKAFAGFSSNELAVLDGVILDPEVSARR